MSLLRSEEQFKLHLKLESTNDKWRIFLNVSLAGMQLYHR